MIEENPNPCTCVIDNWPATTSMMRCPEHGVPQNLEDTQFPGATPKYAVLLMKPKTKDVIAVAPLYTTEQIQQARELGEALGLNFAETVTIYSLADLDRVGDVEELPKVADLAHKSGCVYAHLDHPGDCYVVRPHAVGCIGLHEVPSEPGTYGQCITEDHLI